MSKVSANTFLFAVALMAGAASGSCSDRGTGDTCYYDDSEDIEAYSAPLMDWCEWCDNGPNCEVSPLADEHCPAGECLETFFTCDEVPIDQDCETCATDDLDEKVRAAFAVKNEEDLCYPGGPPREIIDFERGCMLESPPFDPPNDGKKNCCYTAVFALDYCEYP